MWAALAKGAMSAGRVARTAGRGSRVARSMFGRKRGKNVPEAPASEQIVDVQATPVNSTPTTPLIPSSPILDPKSISKTTSSLGTETLEGTAFRIKTTLIDVDTLLKGSLTLDKMREKERTKGRKKKERKGAEKELEEGTQKNRNKFGLGKLVPPKAKGIFGNIINFFVTLLLGKVLMGLLDNPGLLAGIAKGLVGVANFLIKWGGRILNAFVGLIDFGYKIYDGIRGTVGKLFGESGLKVFDNLSKTFVLLLNTALIAAMAGSQINQGLDIVRGRRFGKTSKDVVRRYARRFGEGAARRKFGNQAVKTAGKKFARSGVTRLARTGITKVLGRGGSKALLRLTKNFVSPVIKRIPLIGGLIDFALNVFVFKESIGKSAFKAIGAGLGAWLLGAVGSIVPGFGTLLGGVIGGFAGDALGGLIYDMIFGNKSRSDLAGDEKDINRDRKKDKDLSATATSGVVAAATSKPVRNLATSKPGRQVTKKVVKTATKKKVLQTATKNVAGKKVLQTATKKVVGSRVSKAIVKGVTNVGKAGLKVTSGILKSAKKLISPIVKKIPFLGPLLDFLLNVFVFKEPLGRSAFMAIGAGLGAWVGGMLGTLIPVPMVGTAIGAFLGGAGGDMLGGAIYDAIFKGKDPEKKGEEGDKKPVVKPTVSTSSNGSASNGSNGSAASIEGKPKDISEGIESYTDYEEEGNTTFVVSQKSPPAITTSESEKTNETTLKLLEGMMLSTSDSKASISFAELAKR